jgi:hypothetical protein
MSWNVTTKGTKSQVVDAINVEHQRGHMPESHRAALVAEVDQAQAEVVELSSNGSRGESYGSVSISLSKVS